MLSYCAKYDPLFSIPEGVDTFLLTGGRFTGKSHAVATSATMLVNNLNRKCLATRYTMTSAKKSIIPEFSKKLIELGIEKYYNLVGNDIIGVGNRQISFSGIKTSSGNMTASLKGIEGYSIWTLDEAEEMVNESEYDKINFSIRAEKTNYKYLIINPATKAHWIYKRFFENTGVPEGYNGVHDNVCYIHTSYLDVLQHVPDNILHDIELLKKNNPEKYNHIIMGGWLDKAEGVLFNNWRYGKFDTSLPYGYGLDFGFFPDPDVLIRVAIDQSRRKIYVKQELYGHRLQPTELKEKVNTVTNGKIVVADSAEKRLISMIKQGGCNIIGVKKYPNSVIDGIKIMQDYEIIVDNESPKIGNELNNYIEKNGNPIDDYNHCIDAIRYYVMTMTRKKTFKGTSVLS